MKICSKPTCFPARAACGFPGNACLRSGTGIKQWGGGLGEENLCDIEEQMLNIKYNGSLVMVAKAANKYIKLNMCNFSKTSSVFRKCILGND